MRHPLGLYLLVGFLAVMAYPAYFFRRIILGVARHIYETRAASVDDETFGQKVERIIFIILAIIPASISYGMELTRRLLSKGK